MKDNNNEHNVQHSREYYRSRAIRRKRERELKKRRRRIITAAAVVLVLVIVLVVTLVSCVGSCINSESVKTNAPQEMPAATQQTSDAKPSEPASAEKNPDGSVKPEYFDDAVFVGDSVTLSFSMYVESQREQGIDCLGEAYVLAAGSLSYTNSFFPIGSEDCVLPVYQGVQQPIEDSIAQIGAKKVYIMLGMNDVGAYDLDSVMENVKARIGMIKDKSPDARIYIQSVTPLIASKQGESLNNDVIRAFNERMKSFAEQNNYPYLDIYSVLADENGYLREEYCSDPDGMGMHLTMSADAAWEEYLLKHPEGK
ncbi:MULTISPECIES: GDSL-type esterase/lipase family protein [unclassified Ruminococcus]|uniref:GDSL-type esterase/lipase family protein n=1 Tax=unclassified Ruminococcus TaxID=2608920 RepID=UPI00210A3E07|nr:MULTISPECIES: GDSL-type esterase/lipase family protein [unclassified Ruminococcus]MCQ4023363.1 hypothetical protein [Ruminococcus sp. zg-924]MCQ4115730.1 hypothetical protein [Ruminococcus sp. zg-921]